MMSSVGYLTFLENGANDASLMGLSLGWMRLCRLKSLSSGLGTQEIGGNNYWEQLPSLLLSLPRTPMTLGAESFCQSSSRIKTHLGAHSAMMNASPFPEK